MTRIERIPSDRPTRARAARPKQHRANRHLLLSASVLARDLLRPGSGTLALFGGLGIGANEGQAAGRAGVSFGW